MGPGVRRGFVGALLPSLGRRCSQLSTRGPPAGATLRSLEAARVLAEVRLGVRREPEDPIQATAERLARERGTSIEAISDYRQLAALYRKAERVAS